MKYFFQLDRVLKAHQIIVIETHYYLSIPHTLLYYYLKRRIKNIENQIEYPTLFNHFRTQIEYPIITHIFRQQLFCLLILF